MTRSQRKLYRLGTLTAFTNQVRKHRNKSRNQTLADRTRASHARKARVLAERLRSEFGAVV